MIAVPDSHWQTFKGRPSQVVQTPPAQRPKPTYDRRMDPLDEKLQALIREILALPPGSKLWQQKRSQLIRAIQASGKLWRGGAASQSTSQAWHEVDEHYYTALSMTWDYVLTHLDKYDASRASVMTWINNRLRWDILTMQGKAQEERSRRMFDYIGEEDSTSLIDQLSGREDALSSLTSCCQRLYEVRHEAQAIHVTGRPDINCYDLCQDKLGVSCDPDNWLQLRDRDTYKLMAAYYQSKIPTIAGFWTNKCLPFLRDRLDDDTLA
jgi:hypothetical protein